MKKEVSQKRKEYMRVFRQTHRKEILAYARDYRIRNRKHIALWRKNRYHRDVPYRLANVLRARLNKALRKDSKKGSFINDLGCSVGELKSHIERMFLTGMSWENWGQNGWHIDHIIPISSFDLTNREQYLKAIHYTNLQPLWAKDNIRKGATL